MIRGMNGGHNQNQIGEKSSIMSKYSAEKYNPKQ